MNMIAPHHLETPILIADTNAAEAARMEGMLRDVGHRHIRTTNDPREVIGLYGKWPFGLLIVHVSSTEESGLKTIAALKDTTGDHGPAILAVLEDNDQAGRDKVLSAGARDFVIHPYVWPVVLRRIGNTLDIWHLENQAAQTS